MMEADGLVSPGAGGKAREVLVPAEYFDEWTRKCANDRERMDPWESLAVLACCVGGTARPGLRRRSRDRDVRVQDA